MKRLVVCSDGTWNKPDQPNPTNVVEVATTLKQVDAAGISQLLFYDPGVGTSTFDHLRGGAFGVGLSKNIQQAYHFLVFNYEPGDELFFFGFSRGAYTVRSAVGLIRNSGVLKREYLGKSEEAYQLYRRRDDASHPASDEATRFRQQYAHEPPVKFIGVWDTVGALGVPLPLVSKFWEFHDVRLSRSVQYAYQALAIDERRRHFKPALWEQHPEAPPTQVLEQVWFAGVHSNVGGGYASAGLSDIALLWMVNKAEGCGLAFNREYLNRLVNKEGLDPNALIRKDALDALGHSQNPFFWIIGFGNYVRRLGLDPSKKPVPVTKESAATTAVQRLEDASAKYDAKNLREFLQGGGKNTPVP